MKVNSWELRASDVAENSFMGESARRCSAEVFCG